MSVNLKKYRNIKWKRVWARRILVFLGAGFQKTFLRHKPLNIARHKIYVPEGNLFAFCISEPEFNELAKRYLRRLLKTDMAAYARRYESDFNGFFRFYKNFSKRAFDSMSNEELASSVEELDEVMVDFYELQFYSFLVLETLGREVEEKISKKSDGAEILQGVSALYKLTKINKAHNELLLIAKNKNLSDKKIKEYASKYGWVAVYDYPDKPWTWREVKQQINATKEPEREITQSQINRKKYLFRFRKYLRTIKNPTWRKKVEIVHYFAYLKEVRDDYRRQAYSTVRPIWEELAKRLKSTVSDLNYMTGLELSQVLRGQHLLPREEIRRRKNCFALVSTDGQVEVATGVQARQLADFVLKPKFQDIKGNIAYPGKVTGRCKIIYHREEFSNFKNGDILITTMTHPEFLPIMKKAKAIVTDEGGMICHAAIIAREMKKPCIIGTGNATKSFKNGDLVEVDAERGTVRKL